MKLTKRKGFNFFRSYWDVYNELEDSDKLAFIDALLNKQFLGVDPKDLTGMAKFAYISQTHSIESQVKGYEAKMKSILNPTHTPTEPPTEGGQYTPTQQVIEKEKVIGKEEYDIEVDVSSSSDFKDGLIKDIYEYEETLFLENWETCRKSLGLKTHIPKLNFNERQDFERIKKEHTKDEINEAMKTLFLQERIPMDVMILRPKHFLEKFDTYVSAIGCTTIYGKKEKVS